MKMLSVLFLINARVPSDRQGLKADPRSRSSKSSRKFTEYAPSHAFSSFSSMTLFSKQKEFNSEIIFVPIFEYDFGYEFVNDIKCHVWKNAYFVKKFHLICKCLWACPKLKSLPQRIENKNVYINEMYLLNGFN